MAKRNQGTLDFAVEDEAKAGGPVYQGVCKELRAREDADPSIRQTMAGTQAQARSLARCIDYAAGWRPRGTPAGRPASGMQLSALHAQLDALLVRLTPEGSEGDPWEELKRSIEEAETHGRAAAPHAPE